MKLGVVATPRPWPIRRVVRDVLLDVVPVAGFLDWRRSERRVKHLAPPRVAAIEPARVASIQAVNGGRQTIFFETAEKVIVGGHQDKAVAAKEARGHKLSDGLNACDVVAIVAEDVLLRVGTRSDVIDAGVRLAHSASLPQKG